MSPVMQCACKLENYTEIRAFPCQRLPERELLYASAIASRPNQVLCLHLRYYVSGTMYLVLYLVLCLVHFRIPPDHGTAFK